MKLEKSCGVVAYKTLENTNYYLLIRAFNGDIGFPKGHVEPEESEIETALRELKEETNADADILTGFRKEIRYAIPSRKNTEKIVAYFLGKYKDGKIVRQASEVADAFFAPYSEAMKIITFEDSRKLLYDAESFIKQEKTDIL